MNLLNVTTQPASPAYNPALRATEIPKSYSPDFRSQSLKVQSRRRENLPFTVRLVQDDAALLKAVQIRASAYGRHVPEFARQLMEPEIADRSNSSAILLAESKLDGLPLGTMRIQTNLAGPLALERSFKLPEFLRGARLAEATRLGVVQEKQGRLVRTVLYKAYQLYCQNQKIDWMVITARRPLDRLYESLQFKDAIPGAGFIPMAHVGDLPHRVLVMDVATTESRWQQSAHPLYDFLFAIDHPDLQI